MLKPLTERPLSPQVRDLAKTAEQGESFQHKCEAQHGKRNPDTVKRLRMGKLVQALVNGKQAAHAEQQHGDDKAPEVAELAVAKRMFHIRRSGSLLQAHVEQNLVTGIRVGVDRFRQHAAGAGDHRRPGFRQGYAKISQKRIQDGFCCRFMRI